MPGCRQRRGRWSSGRAARVRPCVSPENRILPAPQIELTIRSWGWINTKDTKGTKDTEDTQDTEEATRLDQCDDVKKLRVGVIYGGRSGEHEVSLASAAAVFQNLDPARYEAVAIRIEKDGRWALPDRPPALMSAADVIQSARASNSAGGAEANIPREAHLIAHPGRET